MGETMFKEAKNADAFTQAVAEFTEATQLAPQWADARYDLALAKEAAGDYSGAMADLKLYQQFRLSDAEARTAQDKIYAVEAKQLKADDPATKERVEAERIRKMVEQENRDFPGLFQKLDGAFFAGEYRGDGVVDSVEIRIHRGGPYNAMSCYSRHKIIQSNDPKQQVMTAWSEVSAMGIGPTSETEFGGCTMLSSYRISPDARTLYELNYCPGGCKGNDVMMTYARQ
jgi:tetratricopeptide (TPR) repeat protein